MASTNDKLRKPVVAKRGGVAQKLLSLFLAFTLTLFQIPAFAETQPITNELGSPVPTIPADQPLDTSQDQTLSSQTTTDTTFVQNSESPLSPATTTEEIALQDGSTFTYDLQAQTGTRRDSSGNETSYTDVVITAVQTSICSVDECIDESASLDLDGREQIGWFTKTENLDDGRTKTTRNLIAGRILTYEEQTIQQTASVASVYDIPQNAREGGVDVNVLDWIPSPDGSVTGYRVYRRNYGTSDWVMIHDNGMLIRYLDQNIDPSKAYQYEVRPYTAEMELAPVALNRAANYESAYEGLKPENVLVLINTNDFGFVDIGEIVTDYQLANGKLDPITEEQLLAFLGLQSSDWNDLGNGTAHNAQWHLFKDLTTGNIEVPLGIYYAMRRGIPKENIVFLDNVPTGERNDMGLTNFTQYVINPIKQHILDHNLASKIVSVVSAYRFPLVLGGLAWESQLNAGLWRAFGGNNADLMDLSNRGRHFSRILGDPGYLTTRIDAMDIANARRMIDDAIWAEENYLFTDPAWRETSDLMAYLDTLGAYGMDSMFLNAADNLADSGLFGVQGDNWDMAPNLDQIISQYDQNQDGRLDNTFLYMGWYDFNRYRDWFDWSRGAIGWSLDSASAGSFRNWVDQSGVYGNPWGANIINRGAAASLGAVNEPYLSGHTYPDLFSYYFLGGYTFAEAGYYGNLRFANEPWMYAYDGDPLYTPFKVSNGIRIDPIIGNGSIVGYRHILSDPVENQSGGDVYSAFRDYDLQGNLTQEQLSNGVLIDYLKDGRVVIQEKTVLVGGGGGLRAAGRIWVYDANGGLLSQGTMPGYGPDIKDNVIHITTDGRIWVYRSYSNRDEIDIFDTEGHLLEVDPQTEQINSASIVRAAYDTTTQRTTYTVLGRIVYENRAVGTETRALIVRIENTDGSRLEVDYQENSFNISAVRYYDSQNVLVSSASKNSDNDYYQMKDEASGFILTNVASTSPDGFLTLMKALAIHAVTMAAYWESLRNYLMIKYGMTSEQAGSQIPFMSNKTIWRVEDFPKEMVRVLPDGSSETYLFTINGKATVPDGTILTFNGTQLVSETFTDGSKREYFYRPDGTYYAYRVTNTSGNRISYTKDGRVVSETIGGTQVVYVGYPDKGFSTVADAIYFAEAGNVIQIAAGTYSHIGSEIMINKNLTIRGDGTPDQIIIQGGPDSERFGFIQNATVTFENLTFRNFKLKGEYGRREKGGALFVYLGATLNLNHTIFEGNTSEHGGAIYSFRGNTININDSIFRNNTAYGGGAISGSGTLRITNSTFKDNRDEAYGGGGVSFGGTIVIEDSVFENNSGHGGGAVLIQNGMLTVRRSVFKNNEGGSSGGAIHFQDATGSVDRTLFVGNSAYQGGALALYGYYVDTQSNVTITFSTFSGNLSRSDGNGIIYVSRGRPQTGNYLNAGSIINMSQSIIYGNLNVDFTVEEYAQANVTNSLLQAAREGAGNITGDPYFADAVNGDYRIALDSPAQTPGNPPIAWGNKGFAQMIGARPIIDPIPDSSTGNITINYVPIAGTTIYEIQIAQDQDFNFIFYKAKTSRSYEPTDIVRNGVYYVRVRANLNTGEVTGWSEAVRFEVKDLPDIIPVEGLNWTMNFDPYAPSTIRINNNQLFKQGDAITVTTTDGDPIRIFNIHNEEVYRGPGGQMPSLLVGHYFVETDGDRSQFAVLPVDYGTQDLIGGGRSSWMPWANLLDATNPSTDRFTGGNWTALAPTIDKTNPDSWDWTTLDRKISDLENLNRKIIYFAAGQVPSWIPRPADSSNFQEYKQTVVATYKEFVTAVLLRYGSRIYAWEVWNEPNPSNFGLTYWNQDFTELYLELAKTAMEVRNQIAPSVKILGPSWNTTRGMQGDNTWLQNNGINDVIDIWSWHDYDHGKFAPDQDYPETKSLVDQIQTAFGFGTENPPKPMIVGELGLFGRSALGLAGPTGNNQFIGEFNSGISWEEGFERAIKLAVMYRAIGVEVIIPHLLGAFAGPSNDEIFGWDKAWAPDEHNFYPRGLHPKTSAFLMASYWLQGATLVAQRVIEINDVKQIFIYEWKRLDGSKIVFAWTIEGESKAFQGTYSGQITDIYGKEMQVTSFSEEPLLFQNATADQIALLVDPSLFTASKPVVNPIPDSQTGEVNVQFAPLTGAVIYQVQVSRNADFTDIIYEGFPSGTSEPVTLTENGTYYVRVRGSMKQQVEVGPVSQWSDTVSFNITPPIIEVPGLPWTMPFDPTQPKKITIGQWSIFRESDSIVINTIDQQPIRVFNYHGEEVYQGNPGTIPSLPVGHYFVETNGDRNQFFIFPNDFSVPDFIGFEGGMNLVSPLQGLLGAQSNWIRTGAGGLWKSIEGQRNVYDWTSMDNWVNQNQGHKIMLVVGGRPTWSLGLSDADFISEYTVFVKDLATRYKDKIAAIELWNEPMPGTNAYSLGTDWTHTMNLYVSMARAATPQIDSMSGGKIQILGPAWYGPGFNDETRRLVTDGVIGLQDGYSIHDYMTKFLEPGVAGSYYLDNIHLARDPESQLTLYNQIIGQQPKYFVDELGLYGQSALGIPTGLANPIHHSNLSWEEGLARAAKYLMIYRMYGAIVTPHVFLHNLFDPSQTSELQGWEMDGRGPHPKSTAFLMMAYWLKDATFVRKQVVSNKTALYEWQRADGSHFVIAWAYEGESATLSGSHSGRVTDIYGKEVTLATLNEEPVIFNNATADQIALLVDPSLFTASKPVVNPIPDSQTGEVNVTFTPLTGAVIYQVQVAKDSNFTQIVHEGFPTGTTEPVTLNEAGTYYVRVRGSMNLQVEVGPVSQWSDIVSFDITPPIIEVPGLPWTMPFDPTQPNQLIMSGAKQGLYLETESISIQTVTPGATIRVFDQRGEVVYEGPSGTIAPLAVGQYFVETNQGRKQFFVMPSDWPVLENIGWSGGEYKFGPIDDRADMLKIGWVRGVFDWSLIQKNGPASYNWDGSGTTDWVNIYPDIWIPEHYGKRKIQIVLNGYFKNPSWIQDPVTGAWNVTAEQYLTYYQTWIRAIAQRYGDRVDMVEAFNEPWMDKFPPLSGTGYTFETFYKKLAEIAAQEFPNKPLVGPSLNGPLQIQTAVSIANTGVPSILDYASYHDYDGSGYAPDQKIATVWGRPSFPIYERIRQHREAFGNLPLVVNEVGLYGDSAVGLPKNRPEDPNVLPDWSFSRLNWQEGMSRAIKYALMYGADSVILMPHILLSSSPNDEYVGWESGIGPHPKTTAFLMANYWIANSTFVTYRIIPGVGLLYEFQRPDGTHMVFGWTFEGQSQAFLNPYSGRVTDIYGKTLSVTALGDEPLLFHNATLDQVRTLVDPNYSGEVEARRNEILTQVNGEIGLATKHLDELQAQKTEAQAFLDRLIQELRDETPTVVPQVEELKTRLKGIQTESGLTDILLAQIGGYLNEVNAYLSGGLTTQTQEYIAYLSALYLGQINADIASWQAYLDALVTYQGKVTRVQTLAELETLAQNFPVHIAQAAAMLAEVEDPRQTLQRMIADGTLLYDQAQERITIYNFTHSQPVVSPISDTTSGSINVQFSTIQGAVIYQVQVSRNTDFTDIIHEGFPSGTTEPVTLTENGTYYARVRGSMNQQVEVGPVSQWSDVTSFDVLLPSQDVKYSIDLLGSQADPTLTKIDGINATTGARWFIKENAITTYWAGSVYYKMDFGPGSSQWKLVLNAQNRTNTGTQLVPNSYFDLKIEIEQEPGVWIAIGNLKISVSDVAQIGTLDLSQVLYGKHIVKITWLNDLYYKDPTTGTTFDNNIQINSVRLEAKDLIQNPEPRRQELLNEANALIAAADAELEKLNQKLLETQNQINQQTSLIQSQVNALITSLKTFAQTFSAVINQAGISATLKTQLQTFLTQMANYLNPANSQSLQSQTKAYLDTLTANALEPIKAEIQSWVQYKNALLNYKTQIEEAATIEQLNSLVKPTRMAIAFRPAPVPEDPKIQATSYENQAKELQRQAALQVANYYIQDMRTQMGAGYSVSSMIFTTNPYTFSVSFTANTAVEVGQLKSVSYTAKIIPSASGLAVEIVPETIKTIYKTQSWKRDEAVSGPLLYQGLKLFRTLDPIVLMTKIRIKKSNSNEIVFVYQGVVWKIYKNSIGQIFLEKA